MKETAMELRWGRFLMCKSILHVPMFTVWIMDVRKIIFALSFDHPFVSLPAPFACKDNSGIF